MCLGLVVVRFETHPAKDGRLTVWLRLPLLFRIKCVRVHKGLSMFVFSKLHKCLLIIIVLFWPNIRLWGHIKAWPTGAALWTMRMPVSTPTPYWKATWTTRRSGRIFRWVWNPGHMLFCKSVSDPLKWALKSIGVLRGWSNVRLKLQPRMISKKWRRGLKSCWRKTTQRPTLATSLMSRMNRLCLV